MDQNKIEAYYKELGGKPKLTEPINPDDDIRVPLIVGAIVIPLFILFMIIMFPYIKAAGQG